MSELSRLKNEIKLIEARDRAKTKKIALMSREDDEIRALKKRMYAKKHIYRAGAKRLVRKFFTARGNEQKVMDFAVKY